MPVLPPANVTVSEMASPAPTAPPTFTIEETRERLIVSMRVTNILASNDRPNSLPSIGSYGVYQVSEAHPQRYLNEFDFRYSNRVKLGIDDLQRADIALVGAKGKRLTYRTVGRARAT
jgi:hypothetical protein